MRELVCARVLCARARVSLCERACMREHACGVRVSLYARDLVYHWVRVVCVCCVLRARVQVCVARAPGTLRRGHVFAGGPRPLLSSKSWFCSAATPSRFGGN